MILGDIMKINKTSKYTATSDDGIVITDENKHKFIVCLKDRTLGKITNMNDFINKYISDGLVIDGDNTIGSVTIWSMDAVIGMFGVDNTNEHISTMIDCRPEPYCVDGIPVYRKTSSYKYGDVVSHGAAFHIKIETDVFPYYIWKVASKFQVRNWRDEHAK